MPDAGKREPAPVSPSAKRQRVENGAVGKDEAIDVDDILDRLLILTDRPPTAQNHIFKREHVEALCAATHRVLMEQDMMLQLETPLNFCGDIHGQFHDLLRIFAHTGYPPDQNFLFLGDYVDRGKRSLETVCLLFAYKVKYPDNFFLLRGNHESPSICRIYGFYDECKQRYNVKLWKTFCDVFNWLPASAVVSERVLCMHGGLSEEMLSTAPVIDMVNKIDRPADVPDAGFLCDLLWSDPGGEPGFGVNERGVSVSFGQDVVEQILDKEDLDLVVRAHQVVEDGYEFFADRRLCTIFSAPNYCGEFDNAGSVLTMTKDLKCSFRIMKPGALATGLQSMGD